MELALAIALGIAFLVALYFVVRAAARPPAPPVDLGADRILAEAETKLSEAKAELLRVSQLSSEEAKAEVMKLAKSELAKDIADWERDATAEAGARVRALVVSTMERSHLQYVSEATTAVVSLPSEELKGRIIGREGRNIRMFEQVCGVDLLIDDSPEVVTISCFDPVRRETARLTLLNLILDGRIHPARIEELHAEAKLELERVMAEAGDEACRRAGVLGLSATVVHELGRLKFRTSYAQNVLDHSVEVAFFAATLASELGCNANIARTAGLLHDIGKALPEDGPHALTGMEFLRKAGIAEPILHAVGAHHHDIEPATPEAQILIVADSISASRPGARRESLDNYVKRMEALEATAMTFSGVDRCFALQAGREIRVLVNPKALDDSAARHLARDLAAKIKGELHYPGQIKVTVIRELRVTETAD